MKGSSDDLWTESRFSQALTSYCFGGLSEADQEAVEHHLIDCDDCWQQFQRLEAAVRTLRFEATLQPVMPIQEVVSLLGLSSQLEHPFGGHIVFVVTISLLYGLEWMLGLWTELGYSYDRFGTLAWALSVPTVAWVAGSFLLALWRDAEATKAVHTNGLARSAIVILAALGALVLCLEIVLPAERTILASFQTRTASGGFLKDAVFLFLPLLAFVIPPFHTILQFQYLLRTGRHQQVLNLLTRGPDSVSPRGMLFLSAKSLTAFLVIAGVMKIVGTNYMLDSLTPGPYAHLFAVASYISTALWFAIAVVSLVWYHSSLTELKRESRALATLDRHDRQLREQ